jgi:hypothetical protein
VLRGDVRGGVRGCGGGGAIARSVGPSAFRFIFCISIMAGGVCILLCRCVIRKPVVPPLPDFTQHPFAHCRIYTAGSGTTISTNHSTLVCFARHRCYPWEYNRLSLKSSVLSSGY